MPYEFKTSTSGGVLTARISGERQAEAADNFRALWAFWVGVASRMKQEGVRRLLVTLLTQGTTQSLDLPAFYRRLGEMGFTADMRAAVVLNVPSHERPVLQLAVTAAEKDGWKLRVFALESDALAWLNDH